MSSPRISRRRTKKLLLALLSSSAIFLLLLLQLLSAKTTTESPVHLLARRHLQEHAVAHSACESTLYPQLCVSTLLSVPDLASKRVPELISITINRTLSELRASSSNCSAIRRSNTNLTTLEATAIDDCLQLFDNTIAELKSALSDLSLSPNRKPLSPSPARRHYHDLQTLFSGAMTNQYTCLDGFAYSDGDVRDEIKFSLYNISRHVSNSLVMLKKVNGVQILSKNGKNEVFPEYGSVSKRGFPTWLSLNDRKLLQNPVNQSKFNLIVAKDGTGNFTTISEAVAAAPNKTSTRFVIYIKAGAYFENVEVDRNKSMLMFLGDGIGKTIVKAGRNVVDGWTTFRSATVAVVGNGFIAEGITFENSAGPSKHQAVALRSGSDLSAFYQCSFVGYQDTLYVHSLRQFYRECDIYGTVDFVFGNAAVVFQNCNLYARKPNDRQKNIITAQGREDPNQNTGISILNCKVAAASDLLTNQSAFKTYLGRPWKEYSRTVYMLSNIGDLIEPAGWLEWNGTFALSTLFYGEYKNRGPGSNTSARVPWPGYRVINDSAVANQFTADSFLQGSEWLNATGFPFYLNLTASM